MGLGVASNEKSYPLNPKRETTVLVLNGCQKESLGGSITAKE